MRLINKLCLGATIGCAMLFSSCELIDFYETFPFITWETELKNRESFQITVEEPFHLWPDGATYYRDLGDEVDGMGLLFHKYSDISFDITIHTFLRKSDETDASVYLHLMLRNNKWPDDINKTIFFGDDDVCHISYLYNDGRQSGWEFNSSGISQDKSLDGRCGAWLEISDFTRGIPSSGGALMSADFSITLYFDESVGGKSGTLKLKGKMKDVVFGYGYQGKDE